MQRSVKSVDCQAVLCHELLPSSLVLEPSDGKRPSHHRQKRQLHCVSRACLLAEAAPACFMWLILKDGLKINSSGISHAWSSCDQRVSPSGTPAVIVGRERWHACYVTTGVTMLSSSLNFTMVGPCFHPYPARFKNTCVFSPGRGGTGWGYSC